MPGTETEGAITKDSSETAGEKTEETDKEKASSQPEKQPGFSMCFLISFILCLTIQFCAYGRLLKIPKVCKNYSSQITESLHWTQGGSISVYLNMVVSYQNDQISFYNVIKLFWDLFSSIPSCTRCNSSLLRDIIITDYFAGEAQSRTEMGPTKRHQASSDRAIHSHPRRRYISVRNSHRPALHDRGGALRPLEPSLSSGYRLFFGHCA